MGKILKLAWFTTKVGIVGGSVYLTADQGVWGTPEQTTALCKKVYDVVPGLKNLNEEYFAEYLPRKDDININFRHYWNSAVLFSFDFLADSPTKAVTVKDYLVDTVSSFLKEEPVKEQAKAS